MPDTFWDLLEARARTEGTKPAIVQGDRTLTFAEWRDGAEVFAAWYTKAGGGRGGRVLLWMDSSPEMAIAMLGAWRAGAIFALMDPKAKAAQFEHALRTATPFAIIRDDASTTPADSGTVPVVPFASLGPTSATAAEPVGSRRTDPASIVFTSGSTGRPKGVTQSHGNLLRGCEAVTGYLGVTGADRILCSVPWSFDYGYGQLLSTLFRGATQVLPSAPNPFAICEAIARHRPTVFAGIPSLFTYLLRGVSPFKETDLSSIATVTNTGGRIPGPVLEELFQVFEGRRIFLNYGLTETYRTSYLDPALAKTRPTSIGRPIPGVDIVIVRDDGTLAGPMEEGQIVHRGDYICLGYWNDPEATAKSLRPDPLAIPGCPNPGPALFTGDYGYLDQDGFLYFVCRKDAQLKSMGVRVSPPEVEELIYASDLVNEVAVLGKPHEMLGDEIWAAIAPKPAVGEDAVKRITEYCRTTMSPYMMPRRYLVKTSLPKTTTGKTDYQALRAEINGGG